MDVDTVSSLEKKKNRYSPSWKTVGDKWDPLLIDIQHCAPRAKDNGLARQLFAAFQRPRSVAGQDHRSEPVPCPGLL